MKIRIQEWEFEFHRMCIYWDTVRMNRNFWADLICFLCGGYYKGGFYRFPTDWSYQHFCFLLSIKPYWEPFTLEDMVFVYYGSKEAYTEGLEYKTFPLEEDWENDFHRIGEGYGEDEDEYPLDLLEALE